MFVFNFLFFFACSLKTIVSKISAGFSKCGCELGGSAVYDICRLQTADRRLQTADCMRQQD